MTIQEFCDKLLTFAQGYEEERIRFCAQEEYYSPFSIEITLHLEEGNEGVDCIMVHLQ